MWLVRVTVVLAGAAFAALLLAIFLQALGVIRGVPFSYNIRNVVVRWRTSLLTALAFTLVVGLMTVMLAFVNGMYALTEKSGVPENVIVLADGATDEVFSNLGYGDVTKIELEPGVERDENNRPLASWEVYILVNQPIAGATEKGRRRRFIQVRGVDDPARSGIVHRLALHPGGHWFGPSGVMAADGEQAVHAVIGEGIARELGHDVGKSSLEVGDVFDLGPRKWMVAGVLRSGGSTFDSEVWAKRQLVGEMFGKNSYTTVVLRAASAPAAAALATDLVANFKTPAVAAVTEPAYYERLNGTNAQFLGAIIVVAVIMAIGGVFGVMNTMFAAIAQRTKDIGVLRILGYSRRQVLVSFFLEALLLSVLGGVIGCAIGFLANGWTATSIISSGQGGGKSVVLKLVVDGKILATGMVFSLVMGYLGGLLPSLSAMRLKPLDSVR
jgi:ABC-type lipoprotein release transport system permease subunit